MAYLKAERNPNHRRASEPEVPDTVRDILLIAVVMACTAIAIKRPVFGMLSFTCFGLLNPHTLTWNIGRTFPLALLTAVATMIGYLLSEEKKRIPFRGETVLLAMFLMIFGVSTVLALYPERAFSGFVNVSKIFLMVILMTAIVNNQLRLQMLMRVIVLSIGFYAVKGFMFVIVTGGQYRVYGPDHTFLDGANPLGMALAMNVPLAIYLLRVETNKWFRHLLTVIVVSSYFSAICTYSRGAWLALGATTAFLILQSKHKLLLILGGAVVALFVLPIVIAVLPENLIDKFDQLVNYDKDESSISRLWNWEFCTRAGLAHPLHGAGNDFYSLEAYAKYYPDFLDRWPGKVWSCHSMWFTVFGEHGFPGLVVWLLLLLVSFHSLWRVRSFAKNHPAAANIGVCAKMIAVAMISFMVGGSFFDALYFDLFYTLVGVIVIMREILLEQASEEEVSSANSGVLGYASVPK